MICPVCFEEMVMVANFGWHIICTNCGYTITEEVEDDSNKELERE